jgi:hypothetical protein
MRRLTDDGSGASSMSDLTREALEVIRARPFPLDDGARVQWAIDTFEIAQAALQGWHWPGYIDPHCDCEHCLAVAYDRRQAALRQAGVG